VWWCQWCQCQFTGGTSTCNAEFEGCLRILRRGVLTTQGGVEGECCNVLTKGGQQACRLPLRSMVTAIRLMVSGLHGSVPPRIQLPAAPATPPGELIRRNNNYPSPLCAYSSVCRRITCRVGSTMYACLESRLSRALVIAVKCQCQCQCRRQPPSLFQSIDSRHSK
jgi:hypothetical protein